MKEALHYQKFDHTRRKAELDSAIRSGKLWRIIKAEFALDIESMFDSFVEQMATLDIDKHAAGRTARSRELESSRVAKERTNS